MPIVAPYRETPGPGPAGALPSRQGVAAAVLAVLLALLLAVPVIALALQPFSMVATLVAGALAAFAAATYARICFSR